MVQISIQKANLVVIVSDHPELFKGVNRTFFTIGLGFDADIVNMRYSLADQSHIFKSLSELIAFLNEKEIPFDVDNEVQALQSRFAQEKLNYEDAVKQISQSKKANQYEPVGVIRTLRPYQERGVQHLLVARNSANFSVPGSGKTTVIYAAFSKWREEGFIDKLLVIGPRSCFLPWEQESSACFGKPLKSVRLGGNRISRQSAYLQPSEYELFLTTYQTAANDVTDIIALCKSYKMLVVIDESHHIKRIEGGVWASRLLDIAPYAARRVVLSGTPMPNSIEDIWSQITFLWPTEQVLGDRDTFRRNLAPQPDMASISATIKPLIFRTTKSELGLPKPVFKKYICDLNEWQAKIYRALSAKFLSEIDLGLQDRQLVRQLRRAKIIRLLQAASNPTLLTKYSAEFDVPPLAGDGASITTLVGQYPRYEMPIKFTACLRIAKEILAVKQKVIIWTSFVHNIEMLARLFKDNPTYIVHGGLPGDDSEDEEFNREQQLDQFKTVKDPCVLIANPAACAESISLHKTCMHAIYLDRTFNCGQYMQSLDRIHRIGLNLHDRIFYHLLIVRNSIDETVDRRLKEKERRMLSLLEDPLPFGSLGDDASSISDSENEEELDFREVMKDAKKQLGTEKNK